MDSANGTKTAVTFSGAATSESEHGVYCKLWIPTTTELPFLEILGTDSESSAEIKLWNFALDSGQSRQEMFSSTGASVTISVQLVASSSGFSVFNDPTAVNGMCTTAIDQISSDSVSGSFNCGVLPAPMGTTSTKSLAMTFDCPLQP
jgi:hypothetical protein